MFISDDEEYSWVLLKNFYVKQFLNYCWAILVKANLVKSPTSDIQLRNSYVETLSSNIGIGKYLIAPPKAPNIFTIKPIFVARKTPNKSTSEMFLNLRLYISKEL